MAGRTITVDFIGNDKSLSSTARRVDGTTGKLGKTLSKVGKVAAIGVAAGAIVAGKALFDMGKAAAEDQVSAEKLRVALEKNAGATDKQVASTENWITAQGKAFGVTDDELRPALGRLVTATHDVREAQKLASLAMDVSAGSGKSLETVSTALMKAQNGQVSALSRLGINTKNAAGETISMEQAVKRMSDTFGGQAATKADTLQGRIDRLKLMLSETGEAIGYKLLPVATRFTGWMLDKGIPAASNFADQLRERLTPAFHAIGDWLEETGIPAFKRFAAWIRDKVAPVVEDFYKDKLETLKSTLANLKDSYKKHEDQLRDLWKAFKRIAEFIVERVVPVLGKLQNEQLKNLGRSIAIVVGVLATWIKMIQNTVGALRALGSFARDSAGKIVDAIRSIPDKLRTLAGRFGDAGRALIGAFVDGMRNASGIITGIAGNVWSAVESMLNGAIDRINSALEFTIDLPGPKNLSVNIADIPHLAKGGVVSRPTLALIGEDGPEAVVPLGAKNAPKGRIGLGGSGVTVNINGPVYGDPRAFAKFVVTELRKEKRLTGSNLGLA